MSERDGALRDLADYLLHRSMTRIEPACHLSDLFDDPSHRGSGVGRAPIEGVYAAARAAGSTRVYWQTHTSNAAGRRLCGQVAAHLGFNV